MSETIEQFRARLNGAAISSYILVMLIVPLKLWCRMTSGARRASLGWDDAISVLALASANAFFYVCMLGMGPNLGLHVIEDVPISDVIGFLKFLFAGQLLYVISLATIKFTILAFYWRLFSVALRIPILIALFIVTAWALSVIFVVIFTCDPIRGQWDLTVTDAKCISLGVVYISGSTPNVITDLMILLLPLPYVWGLHAPLGQRLILVGMFMLGCFVSIVSIVRLTILVGIPLSSSDVTYNTKEVIVWSIVEINIGLVCACLPSMKPALRLLHLDRLLLQSGQHQNPTPADPNSHEFPPTIGSDRSRGNNHHKKRGFSNRLFSSMAGMSKMDDEEDSFQMINQEAARRGKTEASIEAASHANDTDNESHEPPTRAEDGSISVQRDWSVLVDEKDKHKY